MDDNLITLATFDNLAEAHLVLSKLKNYEIPAVIFDENMTGLNPFYSQVTGGAKIKVPKDFYEKALEIINEEETSE